MNNRLSLSTLDRLPQDVRRPRYEISALRRRMVHLGVGAFHRAHQAVFTDDANEARGDLWGVTGVSLRSATAGEQLNPQDGLFAVHTRAGEHESWRVVGNLREVITAPRDPDATLRALTDPQVSVVTLTITEKGYGLDPATGALLPDQDTIAHDLRMPTHPRSAIGYLVKALDIRRAAGLAPFTIVSCDNLPRNGRRLASALHQFAEAVDADLARFVEAEVACPSTMVDRIVPATTDDDRAAVEAVLGLRDEGYVKTEPFMQWVIEDHFSGDRPAWEDAGAMLVANVDAYEHAKLRLLNGPHSAIAYLGYLSGHNFVHEVMDNEVLASFITKLMDNEIAPTLSEPAGMPLAGYARDLRVRFRNPALQHRTWQIAMDGSQKIPQRLLDTIRDRIRMGAPFERLALALAGWMVYAGGTDLNGTPIDVRDPLAGRLAEIASVAGRDAAMLVTHGLRLDKVFGNDLPGHEGFRLQLVKSVSALFEQGPVDAARGLG